MIIYLVRHPQTVWNKEKKMQGWLDSPLTEEGEAVAHMLGEKLKEKNIGKILSSDLGRCVQTANIINSHIGVPFESSKELREQNFGKWAGGPRTEAILKQLDENPNFAPPDGESRSHMGKRWMQAFQKAEDHTLIVTHEGCLMTFLSEILHKPIGECKVKQNEIVIIEIGERTRRVHVEEA